MTERLSSSESVYETLRDDIKHGFYRPGERIDISLTAMRLHTSISPVRTALQRLLGARLVDAHRHEGFFIPHLTEVDLREQFEWSHNLALIALRRPSSRPRDATIDAVSLDTTDTVGGIESLLVGIGRLTPSLDLQKELFHANIRLHRAREIEVELLPDLMGELREWQKTWLAGDFQHLAQGLAAKHRRRRAVLPEIIERLHHAPPARP